MVATIHNCTVEQEGCAQLLCAMHVQYIQCWADVASSVTPGRVLHS